jgi:hypothetical protein
MPFEVSRSKYQPKWSDMEIVQVVVEHGPTCDVTWTRKDPKVGRWYPRLGWWGRSGHYLSSGQLMARWKMSSALFSY